MLVTNLHGVEEALTRGRGIRSLYACRADSRRIEAIIATARSKGVMVTFLDRKALERMVPGQDCRGLVLDMEEPASAQIEFDDFLVQLTDRVNRGEKPIVLALDGVTDPHNVGAMLRSADKFGALGIIVPRRRSAGDGPVVQASSAGASNFVPLVQVGNLVRSLEQLKSAGMWIWGADMNGPGVHTCDAGLPLVLLMGSEGRGLSTLVAKTCDQIVSIPCGGHVDSLNVSNACAVLLYECQRQRGFVYS